MVAKSCGGSVQEMNTYKQLPLLTVDQWVSFTRRLHIVGDCWEWQGARTKEYGSVSFGTDFIAHRVAYLLGYGIDPGELQVCHTCDNPPCCRPAHLFLGTSLDNTLDRISKGRRSGRFAGISSKLDNDEIIAIQQSTDSLRAAAKQFNVSHELIRQIRHGMISIGR